MTDTASTPTLAAKASRPAGTPAPATPATQWFLSGRVNPGEPVMRIGIDSDSFTVGRRNTVHLPLKSLRVSGRHAELLLVGGHLFIRDLGSTNGTFVNGERLDRTRRVREGDHLEFADVEFRVEFEEAAAITSEILETLKKTNECVDSMESAWVFSQFNRLIGDRLVTPFYQPIVQMQDLTITALEALARSAVPGLNNPKLMFDTAELLGRNVELSTVCRDRAIEVLRPVVENYLLFVNTHPDEDLEQDVLPHL